jgi:hypothetical protein
MDIKSSITGATSSLPLSIHSPRNGGNLLTIAALKS